MGMDVYGINPKTDNGDYFRANVWWWRPLWECVSYYCDDILSQEDIIEGTYNNGYEYNETTALEISNRLESLLKDGTLYKYKATRDSYLEELPDEECKICDATGKRKKPAKIGVGNIVEQVVVVSNEVATTEKEGVDFLNNLYGTRDVWKQTSYNTFGNIHKLEKGR